MNWYYSLINLLSVIFCVLFLRYYWYRAGYFLHIFQQLGYKHNEFKLWRRSNWDSKIIPVEIALYTILIFMFLYPLGWLSVEITRTALSIILFVLSFFWFSSVKRYKPEKVKKPLVYTPRVKRLMVLYVILIAVFPACFTYIAYTGRLPFLGFYVPNYEPGFLAFDVILLVFGWVFGAIFIPFFLSLSGRLISPVEKYVQRGFIREAKAKLASMPALKIVAITGSYGKTSTKFMIRDLLKERYSVCATPGSFNTPMGICKVINDDLQSHHQILILEMGARYSGNIQELCDIAKPDVAVITNVGVAHLETFGSQEAIVQEKSVLVHNLGENGIAVLNADDENVRNMGEGRTDIVKILAGLTNGDIQAGAISYDTSGSHFEVHIGSETERFQTKLLGAHNVQNMLLAVGVAYYFGVRPKTMAIAAQNIEPVEHRLQLKQAGDLFVIDDAFNSNPVGAKNAVGILRQFTSGKRIIITPGMVELGELEYEENKAFGKAIGEADLDLAILVGDKRSKPILEGILEVDGQNGKVRVVNTLFEANELVRKIAVPGDIILYENDLPDVYNE